MLIDSITVTHYPPGRGPYTVSAIEAPSWQDVESEIRTMDSWQKPLLWLHKERDVGDRDCLAICGGNGIYHIQIADENGDWRQACDPVGSEEVVVVWRSDQGFSAKGKFTWPLEKTIELVRWYFDRGTAHPHVSWL